MRGNLLHQVERGVLQLRVALKVARHNEDRQSTRKDGKEEELTAITLLLHYLTISWKVVFAFIPPSEMRGGWPAFAVSLAFIAIMTVVVGDLAGLFGCVCGLDPGITAITFVALGTSMPDLFASKVRARLRVGVRVRDGAALP